MLGLHPSQSSVVLTRRSFPLMTFIEILTLPSSKVTLKSFKEQMIDQSPQILWSSLASGKDEANKGSKDIYGFQQAKKLITFLFACFPPKLPSQFLLPALVMSPCEVTLTDMELEWWLIWLPPAKWGCSLWQLEHLPVGLSKSPLQWSLLY